MITQDSIKAIGKRKGMVTNNLFLLFCAHIRVNFGAKGILIYSGYAVQMLMIAGYPYVRIAANNDNEAKL